VIGGRDARALPDVVAGADCRFQPKRKPRRGITGVFGVRRSAWGDSIVLDRKQHRTDFHNFVDQPAATGSIRLGSLFFTLPTR